MMRWLVVVLIVLMVVAAVPGAANANHKAGRHYPGSNSGGGLVSFKVSIDGSSVFDFHYTALPEFCSIPEQFNPGPVAIVDHAFSFEPNDFMNFFGTFPSTGEATGTVIPMTIATSCDTLTWTASLGLGGIAELADVEAAPSQTTGSSSRNAGVVAGIAAAVAGALALGGAAWYARRRLAR